MDGVDRREEGGAQGRVDAGNEADHGREDGGEEEAEGRHDRLSLSFARSEPQTDDASLLRWVITVDVNNETRYAYTVIRGFRDPETEKLFRREKSRAVPPDLQRVALRKLVQLDAAYGLNELRVPPGNRLEALRGDRKGQHRIRVNERWRVCFVWRDGDAHDVEIVD